MGSAAVLKTTVTVETAYYILLDHHLRKTPEMTTRALRNVKYVTAANSSAFPDMLEHGGNMSNFSLQGAPTFNEVSLIKAVVFGVMFFISLVGNTATLMQMFRLRRRKSTINTLIVNLAIADLFVTFFCIAGEAVWAGTVQWIAGNITCKIVKYLQVFALYLSTYIIIAISLDRCIVIVDPMRRQGATQRVRIMMALAWGCSALFSIPQAIVFHVLRGPFQEEFYQCVTFGSYKEDWQRQLYSVASLLLMFVLPLVIIGTAYGLIFTTISRKSREVSVMDSLQGIHSRKPWVVLWHTYRRACLCGDACDRALSREGSIVSSCSGENGRGPVRSNLLRRAKRKSLRMSVFIVLAFIVCWTPYYIIFTVCVTFLEMKEIHPKTLLWFSFIGLSNSMLNPIIYGAFQLCKVHRHRSWRRDEWPVSSLKIMGCGLRASGHPLHAQRQPDTRANNARAGSASGSGSGGSSGSRSRLLPLCRCDACLHERRQQQQLMMSPMTQESGLLPGNAGTAGLPNQRCIRFTHKHFLSGEARRCCLFHSY